MRKCLLVTLLVISAVFFSACTPLLEPPGTPTVGPIGQTSDQPTPESTPLASSQLVDGRFYETNGVAPFSYVPPEGWTSLPPMQSALTGWLGPVQSGGMKCLMGLTIAADSKYAKEAAQEALSQIPKDQMDIEILDEGEFSTQTGVEAYRIIMRVTTQSATMIFGVYMFSQDGYLISTSYYRLADENPEQDAIIEESMKTIQFE